MIKIRLKKIGSKKKPFYRIVATDSRKKISGQELEAFGFWNPLKQTLKIEKDRVKAWIGKGAQLSDTVRKLIEK